jgi:nucleotide-binding universal stress UspA family protein
LWGHVSARALDRLSIRPARPGIALRQAAAELGAGLIVVGGKHHSRVGEWMGRSTAMDLIRTTEVPVLITTSAALPRRILVALDTSAATCATLEGAERYAELCGAKLKVVSVVEPLPIVGDRPFLDPEPYYEASQALIEKDIWTMVGPQVEREIAFGVAPDTIVRVARAWSADLLVVGSHGKGWFERVLVGSVTERLVHALPTALIVIPVFSTLVTSVEHPEAAAATA